MIPYWKVGRCLPSICFCMHKHQEYPHALSPTFITTTSHSLGLTAPSSSRLPYWLDTLLCLNLQYSLWNIIFIATLQLYIHNCSQEAFSLFSWPLELQPPAWSCPANRKYGPAGGTLRRGNTVSSVSVWGDSGVPFWVVVNGGRRGCGQPRLKQVVRGEMAGKAERAEREKSWGPSLLTQGEAEGEAWATAFIKSSVVNFRLVKPWFSCLQA